MEDDRVFAALPQRVEPDEGADDEDGDGVSDECPVEEDEARGDVVPLRDGEDGDDERD